MAGQYNTRSPAVKRIVQELKEMAQDDSVDICAEALEDNIFEWHFAIRGAWDTEFEGGIYHGRILMPAEYPFKPPAFVMLTPSGRFETGTKICLSISSHHPESWQPSWSVRSALVALIAFMQTPGSGAVGSLDHPPHARRQMAAESRMKPPAYGNEVRQQLIQRMHARMLELEPQSRQLYKQDTRPAAPEATPAEAASATAEGQGGEAHTLAAAETSGAAAAAGTEAAAPANEELSAVPTAAALQPPAASSEPGPPSQPGPGAPAAVAHPALVEPLLPPQQEAVVHHQQRQHHSWEDKGLTYLAVLLGVLILALLIRKVLVATSPFKSADDVFGFDHVAANAPDLEL